MLVEGKLCSLKLQRYIPVPLTAMTQLKNADHVRQRNQGEMSAAQQVSFGVALLDFLKHGQK